MQSKMNILAIPFAILFLLLSILSARIASSSSGALCLWLSLSLSLSSSLTVRSAVGARSLYENALVTRAISLLTPYTLTFFSFRLRQVLLWSRYVCLSSKNQHRMWSQPQRHHQASTIGWPSKKVSHQLADSAHFASPSFFSLSFSSSSFFASLLILSLRQLTSEKQV